MHKPQSHSPVRIAYVGGAGHHYLRSILADSAVAVEAVSFCFDGIDDEAGNRCLDSIRQKRPDVQVFHSWPECLDTFKPTLVSVGSVYGHAAGFSIAALQRHIPVVSDKPIAGTWDQHRALSAACAGTSAPLVTEFDIRTRPEVHAAKSAVASGAIGTLALVVVQKSYKWRTRPAWYASRTDYTSTLLWIASHGIDAAVFFADGVPSSVTAAQDMPTKPNPLAQDHAAAMLRFTSGCTAVVHADFLRPNSAPTHGDDRIRLIGSLGQIDITYDSAILTAQSSPPSPLYSLPPLQPPLFPTPGHGFFHAAMTGDTSLFSSAHSLQLSALLLHAQDAADEKRWVDITPS